MSMLRLRSTFTLSAQARKKLLVIVYHWLYTTSMYIKKFLLPKYFDGIQNSKEYNNDVYVYIRNILQLSSCIFLYNNSILSLSVLRSTPTVIKFSCSSSAKHNKVLYLLALLPAACCFFFHLLILFFIFHKTFQFLFLCWFFFILVVFSLFI